MENITPSDIDALVAALERVRFYKGLPSKADWALDPHTGYLAALKAVAALAERERRLREALQWALSNLDPYKDVGPFQRPRCKHCSAYPNLGLANRGHADSCEYWKARALLTEAQ